MNAIATSAVATNSALRRLLALADETTGFMKGTVGAPLAGWHAPGADNRDMLAGLYDALSRRHPQAGQPFWAVRMWTNMMWQPAYLMVVGVHFAGEVPDLRGMSQRRVGPDVDGFRHVDLPMTKLPLPELIDHAGHQLRRFADGVFDEINAITKLKRVPALRLLTDRMLGTMTMLQRTCPGLDTDSIRGFNKRWLAAMGLTGQGDLDSIFLPNGREALIIARKGCCLDYLGETGTYCASCPKQTEDVRLARQRANTLLAFS